MKETRHLLGSAAPARDSLDELREARRVMRTVLLAAMLPLGLVTATDVGLAKIDARVGATATSTHVGTRCFTAWLRRVTDSWVTQCIRFRQLEGTRPCLADCIQQHDTFLATRTQAAALRAPVLKPGYQEGGGGKGRGSELTHDAGERRKSPVPALRRGGKRHRASEGKESEGSDSGGGGEEVNKARPQPAAVLVARSAESARG